LDTKKFEILSTKKLPDIEKENLLKANINLIEEDFIETFLNDFDLKKVNEVLIFTSQNGVKSILNHAKCEQLKVKDVFCVGLKTKALLEENGFKVEAYTGYASDLAEIIALIYADKKFTFFSGNMRRDILPDALKEAGIIFNEIEVYQTKLSPHKINTPVDGILFFSPSAVESYLKMNKITSEICFCIGNTTAETLEAKKIKNIVVANQPTIENTIIQCINQFK
jgi:uroporphyrinogen-III synthase